MNELVEPLVAEFEKFRVIRARLDDQRRERDSEAEEQFMLSGCESSSPFRVVRVELSDQSRCGVPNFFSHRRVSFAGKREQIKK